MASDRLIRNVPADVKRRLVEDADRMQVSVNQVALTILGAWYQVPVAESGKRTYPASPDVLTIVLQAPKALQRKIELAAVRNDRRFAAEVIETLRRHYG